MVQTRRFAYTGLVAAGLLIPAWGCSNEPAQAPPDAPTTIPETSVELPDGTAVSPTDSAPETNPATAGTGA